MVWVVVLVLIGGVWVDCVFLFGVVDFVGIWVWFGDWWGVVLVMFVVVFGVFGVGVWVFRVGLIWLFVWLVGIIWWIGWFELFY